MKNKVYLARISSMSAEIDMADVFASFDAAAAMIEKVLSESQDIKSQGGCEVLGFSFNEGGVYGAQLQTEAMIEKVYIKEYSF